MNVPTANARDLLGEIVTWDMQAQELPLATVRQALDDSGLPPESIGDLRTATAFGRAIKELKEGRAIDRIKTDTKSGIVHFQFTRKTLEASGLQIDFAFEALCSLDLSNGWIECPGSPQIEAHARAMFAHAVNHRQTSDITRLVQRLFEQNADLYPINPRKGVAYFVPERFRAFSAQMEDFLSALGGTLLRFPVPTGTESGNRSVRDSVENGLLALSEELQQAVDTWNEKTRGATMDHAVERWQTLKHKAESYAEYLGDRQATLLATLATQRQRLAAKITEISALKENVKSCPQADGTAQQTLFSTTRPEEPATLDPNAVHFGLAEAYPDDNPDPQATLFDDDPETIPDEEETAVEPW
jgi:hypothetical protein